MPQVNELNVNSVLSRQNLITEQADDSEIRSLGCYGVSEKEAAVIPSCYFWKEGVYMRKWRPPEVPASDEWKVVYQIVLPHKYRHDVLSIAHETPMAAHLGVSKTYCKALLLARSTQRCKEFHYCMPYLSNDGKTKSEATSHTFETHPSAR